MDLTELKELLKGTSAFSLLSDDELGRFGQHFEVVHYTLGQSVVRAGDESDSFYVVYSGRARVIGASDTGDEVTVARGNRRPSRASGRDCRVERIGDVGVGQY